MSAKKSDHRTTTEKIVDKAEKVADDLTDALSSGGDVVPGAPASEPPSVDEPTETTEPLPPKADQKGATPTAPPARRRRTARTRRGSRART